MSCSKLRHWGRGHPCTLRPRSTDLLSCLFKIGDMDTLECKREIQLGWQQNKPSSTSLLLCSSSLTYYLAAETSLAMTLGEHYYTISWSSDSRWRQLLNGDSLPARNSWLDNQTPRGQTAAPSVYIDTYIFKVSLLNLLAAYYLRTYYMQVPQADSRNYKLRMVIEGRKTDSQVLSKVV